MGSDHLRQAVAGNRIFTTDPISSVAFAAAFRFARQYASLATSVPNWQATVPRRQAWRRSPPYAGHRWHQQEAGLWKEVIGAVMAVFIVGAPLAHAPQAASGPGGMPGSGRLRST
jgi:hypothetical protein